MDGTFHKKRSRFLFGVKNWCSLNKGAFYKILTHSMTGNEIPRSKASYIKNHHIFTGFCIGLNREASL